MSPERTKVLFDTFPDLYRGKDESLQYNLMPFGFECGDGWFELVWKLSDQLTRLAKYEGYPVKAFQVKEKFGGLRFYTDGATDIMDACIGQAESRSECTCEYCGCWTTNKTKGWITTVCTVCLDKLPVDSDVYDRRQK